VDVSGWTDGGCGGWRWGFDDGGCKSVDLGNGIWRMGVPGIETAGDGVWI